MTRPLPLTAALIVLTLPAFAQRPTDQDWPADAVLEKPQTFTVPDVGAIQGATLHNGKVYLYGDVWDAEPRCGVIREYTKELKPTGKAVWLRRDGKPLLLHPTGLTFDEKWGCFLGDTVNQKAIIYRLDWDRAWKDGHLDKAVLDEVSDDAAVNGCRPEFVTLGGKCYLASADYGDVRPEVRLYDVEKLLSGKRTSSPGVVAHRFLCGPFNQNLHWDEGTGRLTCVQNVVAGLGWRLDVLDLAKAVADGRAHGPGARVRTVTLFPHSELEGYRPFDGTRGLFVAAARKDNVVIGETRTIEPRPSPAGYLGLGVPEK